MERSAERPYAALSAFELKNRLLELARHRSEQLMLNAGRGNPDWVALEPRAASLRLAEFPLAESRAASPGSGFGGVPRKFGIAQRLLAFLAKTPDAPECRLLAQAIDHARNAHGIEPDLLAGEWADGALGDHHPVPVRMLAQAERLVRAHLVAELFGGDAAGGRFDLFAVEGASAGIAYVFQTLIHSGLLAPGDRIALGVPIFTPYLEVPAWFTHWGVRSASTGAGACREVKLPPTQSSPVRGEMWRAARSSKRRRTPTMAIEAGDDP